MAKKDKERYEEECTLRDRDALIRQEEKRKAYSANETETRMRGSTLANTDKSNFKENNKRRREISEKEKAMHEEKRQVRKMEADAIKDQMQHLKDERAQQAEARLKYLLSQSDIFSHFGATKNLSSSSTSMQGKNGSRRRPSAPEEEMDDDERAMAKEVGDDDDNEAEAEETPPQTTVLLRQPSCVSGGAMRSYQLEGLNWMIRLQENGINGILADEMGLGKTLQSISVLGYLHEYKNIDGPHLVMVPKSTLSNWCNEFKRWCPVLRVLRFHGSKEERQDIIQEKLKPAAQGERDWDVVITTYEVVNLEKGPLTKIAWRYLIIDEAHRLKNEASHFSQTVRLLNTQHRLLLTGTPLQNNLHELWALLNFLLPDVFASSEQFDEWFNLDVEDNAAKERMISQLHKLLRPFMLRRLKDDVEKSLPPKSETILFTGMSTMQKTLYRQILLRDIDTINSASNSNSQQSRTAILNIVMQLRKCCNHPYLFPSMEDRSLDPLGDHLYLNCGKMVLLDKLMRKMKERGHRVLIFSQMTRMLDIMEDYLVSRGYLYCRIDGNTSYEEREDRIYDFNREGSDKFCFILSTRAGGLGINLQTADTVILYDSDWFVNPQADLQAQDRAHRIGQKKPVQVFRFVTDDSVEVKVVERAQQKLKLDAMVVQQGRLQEKDKKMSKQDLIDTLRFGADKIFRSKESTITDADIDLILEEGRKRTEEMNEKLQLAEKGDMYDFRLDGGMGAQIFEGKDYSDRSSREKNNVFGSLAFLDPGKRERKVIASYSETAQRSNANDETDKRQKLPRHLRLNKMEDWQFFDKARLNELQAEEIRLFDQLVDRGEAPQSGMIGKFVVLPADLQEEKNRLIAEGFGDWTRVHYNNFVRASAKHGRDEYEKIAKDIGRPLDETKRYAQAFWEKGPKDLPPQEWERVVKLIEKGEKRLDEISRLTAATAKLIAMFDDPWEELTFRNVGNVGRVFTAVEDRYLLCLTHLHGYGSWDQIRNSVRRCERFRFDFYLQSCSAEAIGKRCELLMRSAERELLEIERKKQSGDVQSVSAGVKTKSSSTEVLRQRVHEISQQIAEESKRLAATRAQLQRMRKPEQSVERPKNGGYSLSTASSGAGESKTNGGGEKKSSGASSGRNPSNPVPEELYPELCRLLKASGPDGITKVVEKFIGLHPLFAKRQVELKIGEIAVKEKQGDDTCRVWHIRPEFQRYLEDGVKTAESSKRKASSNAADDKDTGSTRKKAKKEEPLEIDRNGPKKFKRAFGFFVKAKRAEAEAQLGPEASKTDALKNLLTKMWEEADAGLRKHYEKKEQEDRTRYEKELAAWKKANKGHE
eukprot:scaffold1091_cov164-Ochromonas_danica.AAC.52